ncbi:MAG: hypothetical protein WBN34_12540 [Woeseia sp.]
MEPNQGFATRDDELLSAMLDGELDDAAADALTERLAREPALVKRLEAMRGADASVRSLFAKVDDLPMPQGIVDLLAANSAQATKPAATVIPFPRRMIERFATAPVAIAASVALAAGFLVDRLLEETPTTATGIEALQARTVAQDSAVFELLENGRSATAITLPDGSTGRVLLTFAAEDGAWCRQLSVDSASASVQALACRRNGTWQNEVLAFAEPAGGEFMPASAATLAIVGSAVDRMLGNGEPLDAAAENDILQNGWKKNH